MPRRAGRPRPESGATRGASPVTILDSELPRTKTASERAFNRKPLPCVSLAAKQNVPECRRPSARLTASARHPDLPVTREEQPTMIRTGDQYRESLRDGREVYMDGVRVDDVTVHPMFKPLVDIRARIYDMQHEPATKRHHDGGAGRRAQRHRQRPALHPGRLVGEAPGHRRRLRGDRWDRHPGGRRDGRARCGRSSTGVTCSVGDRFPLRGERREAHRPGAPARSLPRLREHRPQGRPLQAAPGAGPGHAPARGRGDRCRHRGARREVRDRRRLRQPGLHQAHHRELGQPGALRLRSRLHLRPGFARTQVHLPLRLRRRPRRDVRAPTTATTPSRTDSTRSMRSSSSTTYSFPGRTCSSTGTPGRRPSSAPPSTAMPPSRSCSAPSRRRT